MKVKSIQNKSKLKIFAEGVIIGLSISFIMSLASLIIHWIKGENVHSFQRNMLCLLFCMIALTPICLIFGLVYLLDHIVLSGGIKSNKKNMKKGIWNKLDKKMEKEFYINGSDYQKARKEGKEIPQFSPEYLKVKK